MRPGTLPAIGRDAHELPAPLLVVLAALGLAALAATSTTLVQRVRDRRRP